LTRMEKSQMVGVRPLTEKVSEVSCTTMAGLLAGRMLLQGHPQAVKLGFLITIPLILNGEIRA